MVPIIAFSGSSHTGKTTLAHLLANRLHCKFASFGDYVRSEAGRKGLLQPSRRDLQDIGQQLVEQDVSAFCRAVLATAEFCPGERLVLDGVRHKQVLQAVSSLAKGQPITLIYLHAAIETRTERDESSASQHDLYREDSHKVESQVNSELRDFANLIVETSQVPEKTLRDILTWIEHEWPEIVTATANTK